MKKKDYETNSRTCFLPLVCQKIKFEEKEVILDNS